MSVSGFLRAGTTHRNRRRVQRKAARDKLFASPRKVIVTLPQEVWHREVLARKLSAADKSVVWSIDDRTRSTIAFCEIPFGLLSDLPENLVTVWHEARKAYIPLADFRSQL